MGAVFQCVVMLVAVCAVYTIKHTARNSVVEEESSAILFSPSTKYYAYKEFHTRTDQSPIPVGRSYLSAQHNGHTESLKPTEHIRWSVGLFYLSTKHNGYEESPTRTFRTTTPFSPFYSSTKLSGHSESRAHSTRTAKSLAYSCDKYWCSCHKDEAKCTGAFRNLTYVPRVPANTRYFRLQKANLHSLTRSMLANLSNFKIETMDLSRNKIRYVEKDAFLDFDHLKGLSLSNNNISVENLRKAFWSLSEKLEKIWLARMELPDLPEDFFAAFRGRNFSSVDLVGNRLTVLNSAVFAIFLSISKLDVSKNRISTVNLLKQANIIKLSMEGSVFEMVPDFCLHNTNVSAFISLQYLYLARGAFSRFQRWAFRGQCLPSLVKLDIGGSTEKLRSLPDNFVSDLPKLEILMIQSMKELVLYRQYALNSTSLKKILFKNNKEISSNPNRTIHMFKYCPNLEVLTIEEMGVKLTIPEFRQMLLQPRSLRVLKLNNIRMKRIPDDFLWQLPNLKSLSFIGNSLTSYELGRALVNVSSLEYLNVQGNSITVVNETTLPWEFRENIREIDLSHNPFSCTCELLWFRKWLDDVTRNKSITVTSFTDWRGNKSRYICATPADMRHKPLQLFNPADESCAIRNPYIVVGLAIGCFAVTVTVAGVLCYRYRWHLRYYVYRFRRRTRYRQGFEGHPEGGGEVTQVYKYDVYLAHSAQDVEWIVQELLPILEEEHRLDVFLEERDAIGGSVGDNIARYMDDSGRVMLVVSDNYNREGWRQYEFEHILYATFEQHKDAIVLLLGDVEAGRMTQDMRRMLTRGTFLQWDPGEDAKRHFRNGLKVALKTQDVGYQNLC